MLILRRKTGESLVIGDNVKVTVLDVYEGSVRLAIDAPREIAILRSELIQAVDANRDAANEETKPQELLELLGPAKETGVERQGTFGHRMKGEDTP